MGYRHSYSHFHDIKFTELRSQDLDTFNDSECILMSNPQHTHKLKAYWQTMQKNWLLFVYITKHGPIETVHTIQKLSIEVCKNMFYLASY